MGALCPFPTKFKQVWHLTRGGKSLYAWKPIPPDGFVALGMYYIYILYTIYMHIYTYIIY